MNTTNEDPAAKAFGELVRERRKARGWSQEALAAEAFPNSTRKGYISLVENGKIPNITRDTVRTIARALEIDPDAIPDALRWPEANEIVKDTNSIARKIEQQVESLVAKERDFAHKFGVKEGMLIALARRYAEGSPDNFDAALAGLEAALKVSREEWDLPEDVEEAATIVLARIGASTSLQDNISKRVLEFQKQRRWLFNGWWSGECHCTGFSPDWGEDWREIDDSFDFSIGFLMGRGCNLKDVPFVRGDLDFYEFNFPNLHVGERYEFQFFNSSDPESHYYGVDRLFLHPDSPFSEVEFSNIQGSFSLEIHAGAARRCVRAEGRFELSRD